MVAALEGGNFKEQQWHTIWFIAAAFLLISCVGTSCIKESEKPSVETNTKLSDVKGVDEAKAELEEIVDYLKDPKVEFSSINLCLSSMK
ncbi:hypothetical protein MtrunA17_Chr5g0432661 [Medicago truncatula]|uniref:Transmembrane protein n=1 Tax=Medicago truncatula TaxID=3880 RepID=A0A396HTT4_MEDTR|nr:hypothetical protein MtrunA17_Chr5g0432661 [Medicago truncatula]